MSKKDIYSEARVLVVEDNHVNLFVMKKVLEQIGISAEGASSGKECIKKVSKKDYDIIFMDHLMPEMDGVEAYGVIHRYSLKNTSTPIVMLTGNADSSYVDLYRKTGFDGYLVKPVLKDNLIEMIATVTENK